MKLLLLGRYCPAELSSELELERGFGEMFQVTQPLGVSSSCFIAVVALKAQPLQAVAKSYPKAQFTSISRDQAFLEVEILGQLEHANVLRLYAAFEDATCLHVITEYVAGGDLRNLLDNLTERDLRDMVARPMLSVLSTMHDQGIVHRDLKPENILVDGRTLKLADFGLAVSVSDDNALASQSAGPCSHGAGTPLYAAPEVLSAIFMNKKVEDVTSSKNDVWALALIVLEALCQKHPFATPDRHYGSTLCRIVAHSNLPIPSHVSAELRDWLSLALRKDPASRASAKELLDHPWVKPRGLSSRSPSPLGQQLACKFAEQLRLPELAAVECWEY